jgi:hypothetical protein
MRRKRFVAYKVLDCFESLLGRSVYPMIVTPCLTTTSLGTVNSQLPPCSAAMSTMTLPGFMDLTMSALINRGAGRPGINAVVMMMSTSFACLAYVSDWAF